MEETLEQIAEHLKSFNGNVNGEVFRTHADYIKYKEGEDGVKKVEEKLKEFGVTVSFDDIKSFEWKKEGESVLVILVAHKIFNWTDKDVFEMGRFAPRFSFILKVLAQYLVSIESLFKNAEKYWHKNYDFGKLETVSYDKEKKEIIIREREIKTHPIGCIYHAGYFKGLCEFAIKSADITVEESACMHKGSDYHEFIIRWK